ncbi:acyl transferase/acyl hydrolase/lysophospholipase [Flagelloscypha sp. PMI_526]|nr:acyl transferase/acyl hydrolase/lysophospholipase [Flagelloscypha sp. PMI_526]
MQRVAHDSATNDSDESASEVSTETNSVQVDEALPCDHFDLIIGSGDGGWAAAMLGRLGMSVPQTIQAYRRIHSALHHSSICRNAKERTSMFEFLLKDLVKTHSASSNGEEQFRTRETRSKARCKTILLTMTPQNMSTPILIRSYRSRKHSFEDCSVVAAIRATTALPILLEPCKIGGQVYIGACQSGYCNPIEVALLEAEAVFPDAKLFCVLSLGSGHPGHISLPKSDITSVTAAALQLAKDAEQKAQQVQPRLNAEEKIYFRFNVEQGLQQYMKADEEGYSDAYVHTRAYCRHPEVDASIDAVVQRLLAIAADEPSPVVPSNLISTIPEPPQVIHLNVSSREPIQTYINELYNLNFGLPLWDPQRC